MTGPVDDIAHPSQYSEERLLSECRVERTKRSGPGGQHRNKVESAVVIIHEPSGLRGEASERRQQHENRRVAIRRLRLVLALNIRMRLDDEAGPGEIWRQRVHHGQLTVGGNHDDYPALVAQALDALDAFGWRSAEAATWLGINTSQLVKLIKADRSVFAAVNRKRQQADLPSLK